MIKMSSILQRLEKFLSGPDLLSLLQSDRWPLDGAGLNNRQIKRLQRSWSALRQQNIGLEMFRRLFAQYPDSLGAFGLKNCPPNRAIMDFHVNIRALSVEETIEIALSDLATNENRSKLTLYQLGRNHATFCRHHFPQNYWITCGQTLLDIISQALNSSGVNRIMRRKTIRNWRQFLYYLISILIKGYESNGTASDVPSQRKRFSRRFSLNPSKMNLSAVVLTRNSRCSVEILTRDPSTSRSFNA